jgi:hypothetical protein
MCVPSDGLQLGLVEFNSADIDTIIVRKFERGDNFKKLIDTLQWDKSNVVFYSQADTFHMAEFIGAILLQSKFDYQVFFPKVSRTFHITEIDEPQADGNCLSRVKCENIIVSCKLDKGTTQINDGILYLTR